MREDESWGVLTKGQFLIFLDKFTKRFGKPIFSRRLAFSFWDHKRNEIDTRIRITGGKAEIMQKTGGIGDKKIRVRTELKTNLPATLQDLFNAFKIFRLLIPSKDSCYIYQYENHLFKEADFEIKLTHQIGKTDKYSFEVEAYTKKVDLEELLKSLGLSEMVTLTDAKFWDKWNEELNIKDTDLREESIKDLIQKYLN